MPSDGHREQVPFAGSRTRIPRIFCAAIVLLLSASLISCSNGESTQADLGGPGTLSEIAGQIRSDIETASTARTGGDGAETPALAFPAGWLIAESNGIPAGEPLQVLSLPGIETPAHRAGKAIDAAEQERITANLPTAEDGKAVVTRGDATATVKADLLLVNLADVMPEADYDLVYSYSSTSSCAGQAIPGVTGEQLPGYAEGKQQNAYWDKPEFIVPCAFQTALKAKRAAAELGESGYRLLVFDAYRPMRAQDRLSSAFQAAYENNQTIRQSIGEWGLGWYVASGPSGHNFGTDLDVGVCDASGNPVAMPSAFDAFDETGHLTVHPMNAGSITPAAYRDAVTDNSACCALHAAFTDAGFSELASEWWHFGDDAAEEANRAAVGDGGLDFTARLAKEE